MNRTWFSNACAVGVFYNKGIAMPVFVILSRNDSGSSTSDSVVNP